LSSKQLFNLALCIVFIAILLSSAQLSAGIKEDFFLTGRGAKSFALGGTAFAFGTNALYTNPAGLAVLPEKTFSYSYQARFDNMVQQFSLGYMSPWNGGAWALGLIQMNNGNADKTINNGSNRPQVIGSYGETQTGLSVAAGIPVGGNDWAIGFGLQQYFNQIDVESAYATALSLGIIKKWGDNLLLGISAHNLALSERLHAPIQWSTGQRDYFPLRISTALAWMLNFGEFKYEWYLDMHTIEVAQDLKMVNFYSTGALLWLVPKTMSLMFGYGQEQLSAGLGLYLAGFSLDYAFLNHPSLGSNHLFSVGLHF
jgi:hypothetical protein